MDLQPDGFYIRLQTLTVKGFGHLFTRETPYRHSSEFRIEAQSLSWKVLYWTKNNPTEFFFFCSFSASKMLRIRSVFTATPTNQTRPSRQHERDFHRLKSVFVWIMTFYKCIQDKSNQRYESPWGCGANSLNEEEKCHIGATPNVLLSFWNHTQKRNSSRKTALRAEILDAVHDPGADSMLYWLLMLKKHQQFQLTG